ncbi:Apolipoprotein L3, partial [Galemys pyrenaicus]
IIENLLCAPSCHHNEHGTSIYPSELFPLVYHTGTQPFSKASVSEFTRNSQVAPKRDLMEKLREKGAMAATAFLQKGMRKSGDFQVADMTSILQEETVLETDVTWVTPTVRHVPNTNDTAIQEPKDVCGYHRDTQLEIGPALRHLDLLPTQTKEDSWNNFLKDVIEYVLCTVNRQDLETLLNEANVWETFVTEAHLSRDEADAIREGLVKLTKTKYTNEDTHQKEQECREKFLQVFPRVKVQLEEHISQLRELADRTDKVHRDCTISNAVAHSTGIISGILTLLGLGVVSFTAGASLALTATGLGLGAAAAVTSVTASIVEHVNRSSVEAEANNLESADIDILQLAKDILSDNTSQFGFLKNSFMAVYRIAKYVRSIRLTRINPGIAAEILVQSGRLVESAAGTTRFVMSKGARFFSGATAGFFLLMDVVGLVQESKNLQQGEKTELYERLIQQAQELEMMLEKLNQIHESLLGVEEIEKSKFFLYLATLKIAITELIFNKSSAQSSRHLKVVFGGVSQALSKGTRISGAVATVFFLLMDVALKALVPGGEARGTRATCRSEQPEQPLHGRRGAAMEGELRAELEAHIAQLRELADRADKVRRDCTIASMVASSAGIASALLTVTGALLSPFTGGLSLALTATGLGLGAGAIATGTGTAIAETAIASSVQGEVQQVTSTGKQVLEKIKEILNGPPLPTTDAREQRYEDLQSFAGGEKSEAIHKLTQSIKDVSFMGNSSLSHEAAAVCRGSCVLGKLFSVVSVGLDMYSLVEGAIDLAQDWETQLSAGLRQRDPELESLLQELNQTHQSLQLGAHALPAGLSSRNSRSMDDEGQQWRERFLQLRAELEAHIAQLRELADRADKVRRDCTIASMVASSAGPASKLTVTGALLAPFAWGLSAFLAVTGLGAGAAATDAVTAITESGIASSVEVQQLTSTGKAIEEKTQELLSGLPPRADSGEQRYENLQSLAGGKKTEAMHSLTQCRRGVRLMLTDSVMRHAAAVGRGCHVLAKLLSAVSLGPDVGSLADGSCDWARDGHKELSAGLKQQAWELESLLQTLNNILEKHSNFLKEVTDSVVREVSKKNLQVLLTEPQVWATFVDAAQLSREEADELRAKLNELKIHEDQGDKDRHRKLQDGRVMFMKVYPQLKVMLEEQRAQFHQLADWADKVHKDCTITNMVASSAGLASGALTLAGLALAPFTAGASLGLSAGGMGLAVASAGTSVVSSIVEHKNMSSIKAETDKLETSRRDIQKVYKEVFDMVYEIASEIGMTETGIDEVYRAAQQVHGLRSVRDNLGVAAQVFSRGGRLLQKSVDPTSKVVGAGARVVGGIFIVAFVALDVVNLVEESRDLQQGAKTECGAKLRQKAQELEKLLENLNYLHQSLQ